MEVVLDCKPKQSQQIASSTVGEKIIQDDGVAKQRVQPFFESQNDAGVPPIGGIQQTPDSTTQSNPDDSTDSSIEGKTAEQSTTLQDNQEKKDDNQGEDLSSIKNQENVLLDNDDAERLQVMNNKMTHQDESKQ